MSQSFLLVHFMKVFLALEGWDKKALIWHRFIDDIFMIWTHGMDELQKFIYINSIHPKIKFTHENSETSINFLDTIVKIDNDRKLYTTPFEKPTDTHLYLHHTSAHNKPCDTKGASCWKVGSYLPMPGGLQCSMHWFPPPVNYLSQYDSGY